MVFPTSLQTFTISRRLGKTDGKITACAGVLHAQEGGTNEGIE